MAGLGGAAGSLFMVSPHTPVWLWAACAVIVLAVMNRALVTRNRARRAGAQGSDRDINWLGLIMASITAAFVGVGYYYHRNGSNAVSFLLILIGMVLIASRLKKSNQSCRVQPRRPPPEELSPFPGEQ